MISRDPDDSSARAPAPPHAPPSSTADAARALRERLLESGWPDAAAVEQRVDATGPFRMETLRRSGQVLDVWSARRGAYLYPDFQFDQAGRLRAEVGELLALLPANGDRGGWRRAFWLCGARESLNDRSPAEVFFEDSERVIALARADFYPPTGASMPSMEAILSRLCNVSRDVRSAEYFLDHGELVRLQLENFGDEWRGQATHNGELLCSFSFDLVQRQPLRLRLARAYCDLAGDQYTRQGIGTALLWLARQAASEPIEVGVQEIFLSNADSPDGGPGQFILRGIEQGLLAEP